MVKLYYGEKHYKRPRYVPVKTKDDFYIKRVWEPSGIAQFKTIRTATRMGSIWYGEDWRSRKLKKRKVI